MKRLSTSILCLVTAYLQSGCTSWAPPGAGGMAEHHLDTYLSVEADQPLTPEHGLRFDFDLLRNQLEVLVLEGAEYCFPASVAQGRMQEQRIARELYAELYFDAANDILIQRKRLSRLERQLDAVGDICQPPKNLPYDKYIAESQKNEDIGDLSKTLYNLLNSDNQFAVDSYQLNPKYVIRLAEAAVILRQHLEFDLRIIGHTDHLGENNYNEKLSLQRAQQVARYLNVMGIQPSRITSEALGESAPLFDGSEPHVRLVNRRVTIELIDNSNTKPSSTTGS